MNKISISEGSLVYTDERSGERIKADDFDGTIRDLSYGRTEGAEPFKNISFSGDIKCKTLMINNFTLTNLVMRTAGGNGILDINSGKYGHLRRDREGKHSCGRDGGVASLPGDHYA